MFTKSIRGRLLLWLGFLLICILSGFGITAYQLHRTNQFSQIDEELSRRVAVLSSDLRRPPFARPPEFRPFEPGHSLRKALRGSPDQDSAERPGPPFGPGPGKPPGPDFRGNRIEELFETRPIELSAATLLLFNEDGTNSHFYAVWSPGGKLLKASTNAPASVARPLRGQPVTGIRIQTRDSIREAFQFMEFGECALVGRSIAPDLAAIHRFGWLLGLAGTAVLAFGLGGGWLLAARALRPVDHISAAAARIALGNLSERINVADTENELGRLAGVLNSTFARLEAAFAQQKQFTADAAHELRTPIAVIMTETQTTLSRERTPAEYRETIETCLDTAQQMRRLTHNLLELARFDANQEVMRREPFDLAQSARAAIDLVRPLAAQRGLTINSDLQPASACGDSERFSEVIINLLGNAVQYNRDSGTIEIATRKEADHAVLTVSDTGPGIAKEDLPHIFERFYRADKSRSRACGHSGLGLAICKAIVEGHKGTIDVASDPGHGTRVTVKLPTYVR